MPSKILLYSRDPGGCNTIFPLINPLKEEGFQVELYGKDFALDRYKQFGFEGKNLMDEIENVDVESIKDFLTLLSPDFIITDTGENENVEKFIWKAAEELKIPSFAIIDFWTNLSIRFSDHGSHDISEYDPLTDPHPYVPTRILVIDDYCRDKLIADQIDENRILVTGQPYFDYLVKKKEVISESDVQNCRDFFNCENDDCLIVFASEPILEYYNETDDSDHFWGYTEKTIFRSIAETLLKII